MRVLSVFGTRPEAIKMAPVLRQLALYPDRLESVVCVTAQHREMLDQVLGLFGIVPDIDLDLMTQNQATGDFAAHAMAAVNRVLDRVQPDVVLVQGDTTTAAAAAIAAFYRKMSVGHIEAGLRTDDVWCPFPEEINRRLIDVVAAYRWAPTEPVGRRLLAEGYPADTVSVTGNTVVDALQYIVGLPDAPPAGVPATGRVILATTHRREHFGEPLERICRAFLEIVQRVPDVTLVLPVHPNPNVRSTVRGLLGGQERICLLDPMPYDGFVRTMARASLIITDSGGVQEEAPTFGVPVLVIRDKTERGEAVEAGAARLIGTETAPIVEAALHALGSERPRIPRNLFGDGHASERIVNTLLADAARRSAGAAGNASGGGER